MHDLFHRIPFPSKGEMARELLQCLAEQASDEAGSAIYRDPDQAAVSHSAEIPAGMLQFAQDALKAALKDPLGLQRSLGEVLTEPKAHVWFQGGELFEGGGVRLDRRTRMLLMTNMCLSMVRVFARAARTHVVCANWRMTGSSPHPKWTSSALVHKTF